MNHPTSILTDDELDSVSGGVDVDGYNYCPSGPTGGGLYVGPCTNAGPFIEAVLQGAIKGAGGGGSPK